MDDDPLAAFWDVENSGVFAADKFMESLHAELAKAFPGRKLDIHAFGIDEVDTTQRLRDFCKEDPRIEIHFLDAEKNRKRKDRADHKLITELFKFAMNHKKAPLILLLAGDEDFIKAVKTLDGLGYVLANACSGAASERFQSSCTNLEFQWDCFKNPRRQVEPVPDLILPGLGPGPEGQTEVGKALEKLSKRNPQTNSAPAPDNALGFFIDVDTIPVKKMENNFLHHRLKAYGNLLEKDLLTTKLYGKRENFPMNCPRNTDEHIYTGKSKEKSLINCLMAGLGQFAVENGPTSTIVVMSENICLATMIEGFSDAGFDMILVTQKEKEHSELVKPESCKSR